LIKDYVRKPRINVTVPRWPISVIVLTVSAFVLITVVTVVQLSFDPDLQSEELFEVPKEKPEPTKPILTEQTTKPDFTFPEILKQTEVKPAHVKIYESTPKDPNKKTSNLLQVASFKSKSDAKALQKRLIRKQLPNLQVTQSTSSSGSVWYKVMVGPFQNRSMLNKAQDILVQMNFSPLEQKR